MATLRLDTNIKSMETFLSSKNQFIDENQRNVVYGYMRSVQRQFAKSNHHLIIPSLVIHNILYFYHNEAVESFDLMFLKPDLLRGIHAYGFENPSTIQQRAILPIIQNHDLMVQALSGTGKTCTSSIAALQKVDASETQCQILILAPRRDDAQCIGRMIKSLSVYINITTHTVRGGGATREDIRKLSQGVHIVAGTPGRMNDMISRGALRVHALKLLVLDETDEMLDRGYREQIHGIRTCEYLPSGIQVALFSATHTKEIEQLTELFMCDPIRIFPAEKKNLTLDNVRQYKVLVEREDAKLATLLDLFECVRIKFMAVVIYCNTRRKVMWLKNQMQQHDFMVCAFHDAMDQKERGLATQEFKIR
eukprot:9503_1